MKKLKLKLIISYEPSEDFDSEFVDFVECILESKEEKKERPLNLQKLPIKKQ